MTELENVLIGTGGVVVKSGKRFALRVKAG